MSFVALLAALTISVAPGTEAKNATAVSELKYHLKLALGEDPAIVTDGDGTFVVGVKPDGAPDAGSLESRYQVKGGKEYSLAAFARKPDWILTCRQRCSGSSPHVRATATRSGGDGSVILNVQNDANMNLLGRNKYNGGLINGTDNPDFNCGGEHGTTIVGSYRPNSWGLFDTSGNVYEICLDWLESDIKDYGGMININPADPTKTLSGAESERRVLRGGNYEADSSRTRPAFRGDIKPTIRGFYAGFRLYCQGGLL